MKLAVLGDVHANLPALESVLARLRDEGVGRIVHTGDVVGLGPFPAAMVSILRRHGVEGVRGRFDEAVAFAYEWPAGTTPDAPLALEYAASLDWTRREIDFDSLDYLRDLPFEHRVESGGRVVAVFHANPLDVSVPIREGTPRHLLAEFARQADADVVVAGLTHRPFHAEVDGVHVVNAGSVGFPEDGDPRAQVLILDLDIEVEVEFRRVVYDVERTVSAISASGLPSRLGEWIRSGGRGATAPGRAP